MSKNISLLGANYPDVPAVLLPKTGGGTALFVDADDYVKKPVLLWTNTSPSSSFAAKYIEVPTTYSKYRVEYAESISNTKQSNFVELEAGATCMMCGFWMDATYSYSFSRQVYNYTSGRLNFGDAWFAYNWTNNHTDNARVIPLRVYGIE